MIWLSDHSKKGGLQCVDGEGTFTPVASLFPRDLKQSVMLLVLLIVDPAPGSMYRRAWFLHNGHEIHLVSDSRWSSDVRAICRQDFDSYAEISTH